MRTRHTHANTSAASPASALRRGFRPAAARRTALALALGACFLSTHAASAATDAYTGGGTGTAAAPVSGNFSSGFTTAVGTGNAALVLTFAGAAGNNYTATDDIANLLLDGLTFTNAGNVTVAGTNTLTQGAATTITLSNSGTVAVSDNIANGGFLTTFSGTGAGASTFSGAISGTGAVAVGTSNGSLILSGTNTYTGGTTMTSGTLDLNNSSAVGTGTLALNGGIIDTTVSSGTTLSTNNAITLGGNFTYGGTNNLNLGTGAVSLTGNRTITLNAKTLTIGGIISGTGNGITVAGAGTGTLALNGANTYTGTTTLNGGIINAGVADVSGTSGALGNGGNITFTGGTLQYGGTNTQDYSSRIKSSTSAVSIDTNGKAVTFGTSLASTNTGGLSVFSTTPGGVLTLSTSNAYTGATNINGGTLSADVAGALSSGAININPGGTLRTLATGNANLGGGAITQLNGTIQVGNGTVNAVSATLPGVLTFNGADTINLQNASVSTAALTLNGAGSGLVRSTNGSTLIINAAGALDGSTDTVTVTNYATGGNATVAGDITNSILPTYEVGTQNGSANADFLTTVAAGATLAGSPIKAYTGYIKPAAGVLTTTSTGVYELNGAYTTTGTQSPYAIKFDSGATLALGATLNVGGTGSSQGGIIFNGTGDAITGGTFNSGNGELDVYTGGTAAISSNITSSSGGAAFDFFGPGTLTLTGALTNSNSGGTIAINGNVIANLTAAINNTNPVTVNNATLTLGRANIFDNLIGESLTVNGGGTVDLQGNNEVVSNLQGGSSATVPGGTVTSSTGGGVLTLNNAGGTFYGNLGNGTSLGVTKLGTNTANMDGTVNYTGTTTIEGGTLNFQPAAGGTNDSAGTLAFAVGGGTVTSTNTSGSNSLTFSNLTARTAGTTGNFQVTNGINGTTNKIVLTNFNGAPVTPGTLLDPGYFFGGNGGYATVDAAGFVRAYGSGDTNFVQVGSGASTITSNAASNVLVNGGNITAQNTASVNTLNLGGNSLQLANNTQTLSTNSINSTNPNQLLGTTSGGSLTTTTAGNDLVIHPGTGNLIVGLNIVNNGATATGLTVSSSTVDLTGTNTYTGATTVDTGATLQVGNGTTTGDLGSTSGVALDEGSITFNRSNAATFTPAITGLAPATFGTALYGTVTQAGTGALTLGAISNVNQITQAGTGTLTTGNVTNVNQITRSSGTGALTLGNITGIGTLTDNSTTGTTSPTTINQTGTGNTIGTINSAGNGSVINLNQSGAGNTITTITGGNGSVINLNQSGTGNTINAINSASGAVVNLGGAGSTTSISSNLNTAGQTDSFNSGTWNLNGSGAYNSTLVVNGATVNTQNTSSNSANYQRLPNLQVLAGTLNVQAVNGLRLGTDFGVGNTTTNSAAGVQSGGTIVFTNSSGLSLGGNSNGAFTDTFALSGGIFNGSAANSFVAIDAGTPTTGYSSFNFSGGKLLLNGTISGTGGTGSTQSFVWTGGTLATSAYTATNLTSTQGTAVSATSNTLTNAGGILAPGDIGTAGLTTITGNYAVTSGKASYAVDLGGTTAANAFQNATGDYDVTNIGLTAVLGGKLNVGLINSFTPTAANTFTVLTTGNTTKTAGSLSGTFTNTEVGKAATPVEVVVGTSGLNGMSVTYNAGTAAALGSVVLGNYNATANTYTGASGSAWDAASAADWSVFDPGSTSNPATVASGAIAQFADGTGTGTGANTVTLNSTRNIQGVQFSSTTSGHNYTINNAGSGSIILDNTGNAASATIADSSASGNANAINVPISLNSNLAASVTNAANTLTLGGVISDGTNGAASVTKTGAGTLALSGANTYTGGTTISAGTLTLGTGGSLGATAVSVAGGTTLSAIGTTSNTIGGTVAAASGGAISLNNSAINTLNITGAGTDLTLAGDTLNFDIMGATADSIAATGAAAVTGSNIINLTDLLSTPLNGSTLTLISAASGLGSNAADPFSIGTYNGTAYTTGQSINGYNLSLNDTGGLLQLVETQALVNDAPQAYFTGSQGTDLTTAANYVTTPAGGTQASIGPDSNVFIAANTGVANTNYTAATVAAPTTINSLNLGTGAASGGGTSITGSTLTINALGTGGNAAGSGITDNSAPAGGATTAADTVGSAVVLGNSQTVTVANAPTTLTLSGTISNGTNGAAALTKAGNGVLTITGSGNSYSGGTTVNAGTVNLSAKGADGTGVLTVNTGGVVNVTVAGADTSSDPIINGGTYNTAVSGALGMPTTIENGGKLVNTDLTANDPTTPHDSSVSHDIQSGGALTVDSGGGTIDFGAGNTGAVFSFTTFSDPTGAALDITDWNGNFTDGSHTVGGDGLDQLIFGTALTSAQLSDIVFVNPSGAAAGSYPAAQLSDGEVAAAPEPSQYGMMGLMAFGLGGLILRAKKRQAAKTETAD